MSPRLLFWSALSLQGIACAVTPDASDAPDELLPVERTAGVLSDYCRLLAECDCLGVEGGAFSTAQECADASGDAQRQLASALEENTRLEYDPECLAELRDAVADAGSCNEPLTDACACRPVFGNLRVGATCVGDRGLSSCAQGLQCIDHVCKATCGGLAAEGDACDEVACEPGLRCFKGTCLQPFAATSACAETSDPCPAHTTCATVDAQLTCIEPLGDGEPCTGHTQCASLFCPAGYCLQPPQEGQTCELSLCGTGLVCLDGICHDRPALCLDRVPYPLFDD